MLSIIQEAWELRGKKFEELSSENETCWLKKTRDLSAVNERLVDKETKIQSTTIQESEVHIESVINTMLIQENTRVK